jgi:DNA-binding transcriptional LysR family regulator
MDLRRLRHFDVLAETLNFSRAADRLHVAQPALSVSIQKLERELGTKLFDRTPAGVQLTIAGAAALVEARRLLFHGEQLHRAVQSVMDGTGGRLRIGFVGSAIYRLIPTLVPQFRALYPGVTVVLTEGTSIEIIARLEDEALDLGFVRTPMLKAHGATLKTLQRDRMLLALPAGHPLTSPDPLALGDAAGEPFIMYSPEAAGLHAHAMSACETAGFVPNITQEATQIPTVLALGVALVPEVMRSYRMPNITYRDLREVRPRETTLALAFYPSRVSPAVKNFISVAAMLDTSL